MVLMLMLLMLMLIYQFSPMLSFFLKLPLVQKGQF